MDLLRLVLARLPINALHKQSFELSGNREFYERIFMIRAGDRSISYDSYFKLCAFQGEFLDIFALGRFGMRDLYRSRAVALGDLMSFRKYSKGILDLDIAFASGIPEIEEEAFKQLRTKLKFGPALVDVTLIPRREAFRKILLKLARQIDVPRTSL